MIRSIRKRHKLIWIVLAVLLPVLFIAGLALRHHEPVNVVIPLIVIGDSQSLLLKGIYFSHE